MAVFGALVGSPSIQALADGRAPPEHGSGFEDARDLHSQSIMSLLRSELSRENEHAGEEEPPSGQMKKRVGSYELLRKIGGGGMAHVYEARDLTGRHERAVAVKVIRPDLESDPSIVSMFMDEARLGARLQHPNLCPVYEVGEVGETLYIVMELLRGRSLLELRRRLRRFPGWFQSPDSIQVACAAATLAAEGLHAIHEARDLEGIPLLAVHRDVSPQNLLVTCDGSLRVLDLGVARFRTRRHTTQVGTTKGKYLYMAPEQLYTSRVDRRADVWALAACTRELLLGECMFSASSERVDAERARLPIPPLSARRDGVPERLEAVLQRALAYRPTDRTPTALEFGEEVSSFLDHPPETILSGFMDSMLGGGHFLGEPQEPPAMNIPASGSEAISITGDSAATRVFEPAEGSPGPEEKDEGEDTLPDSQRPGIARVPKRHRRGVGLVAAATSAAAVIGAVVLALAGLGLGGATRTEPPQEPMASGQTLSTTEPATKIAERPPALAPKQGILLPLPVEFQPAREEESRPDPGSLRDRGNGSQPASNRNEGRTKRAVVGAGGTLRVLTSQRPVDVYLDGRYLGTTPLSRSVSVGRHQLELRRAGTAAQKSLLVDIAQGAIHQLQVAL